MKTHVVNLLKDGEVVATAQVRPEGKGYTGKVDLALMPPDLIALFTEYESIVNNQVFSLLDTIETRIDHLNLQVDLGDGSRYWVERLELYPSAAVISWETTHVLAVIPPLHPIVS